MAKVTKIESAIPKRIERKRVAAYARVSFDTEQMRHSLSAQVSHYSTLIQKNPEWIYVGVFADRGITGTSTGRRTEFNRMIAECEAGNIDIILVKSISRFARNTVDTLVITRHLKDIGVEVRFEREHISTFSGDGELMLTILAAFAQAESESISTNLRWGVKKRYENGIPHSRPRMLGYRWEGLDRVVIPEEAKMVRFIFDKYIEGYSTIQIPKLLSERGWVGVNGNPLTRASVKDILTNEEYTGVLILQKSYVDKIRSHSRRNRGERPMYRVDDYNEALISQN